MAVTNVRIHDTNKFSKSSPDSNNHVGLASISERENVKNKRKTKAKPKYNDNISGKIMTKSNKKSNKPQRKKESSQSLAQHIEGEFVHEFDISWAGLKCKATTQIANSKNSIPYKNFIEMKTRAENFPLQSTKIIELKGVIESIVDKKSNVYNNSNNDLPLTARPSVAELIRSKKPKKTKVVNNDIEINYNNRKLCNAIYEADYKENNYSDPEERFLNTAVKSEFLADALIGDLVNVFGKWTNRCSDKLCICGSLHSIFNAKCHSRWLKKTLQSTKELNGIKINFRNWVKEDVNKESAPMFLVSFVWIEVYKWLDSIFYPVIEEFLDNYMKRKNDIQQIPNNKTDSNSAFEVNTVVDSNKLHVAYSADNINTSKTKTNDKNNHNKRIDRGDIADETVYHRKKLKPVVRLQAKKTVRSSRKVEDKGSPKPSKKTDNDKEAICNCNHLFPETLPPAILNSKENIKSNDYINSVFPNYSCNTLSDNNEKLSFDNSLQSKWNAGSNTRACMESKTRQNRPLESEYSEPLCTEDADNSINQLGDQLDTIVPQIKTVDSVISSNVTKVVIAPQKQRSNRKEEKIALNCLTHEEVNILSTLLDSLLDVSDPPSEEQKCPRPRNHQTLSTKKRINKKSNIKQTQKLRSSKQRHVSAPPTVHQSSNSGKHINNNLDGQCENDSDSSQSIAPKNYFESNGIASEKANKNSHTGDYYHRTPWNKKGK